MRFRMVGGLLALSLVAVAAPSCTSPVSLGYGEDSPPPSFISSDAGEGDAAEAGLVSYCPSSQCPPGWTTCPDSRFPCDTNIRSDSRNCGECGNACPREWQNEQFMCSEGVCKMDCSPSSGTKDCDGLVDNGCESGRLDRNNCGACGLACPVGKNCALQADGVEVGCGCPPGLVDCGGRCRDLNQEDLRCGDCNNRCDPTGGPDSPQYSNAYYGCLSGQCGKLKCKAGFADCDGDIENGCETPTATNDNCTACGDKCSAGQKCGLDASVNKISCLCDEGLTFCQIGESNGIPQGLCVDVTSDILNCGGCGNNCGRFGNNFANQSPTCDYGKCVLVCLDGAADCNGSQSDGCEIDTNSDPRNCGGCGISCDLTMGQACVAGKCVVEPCDSADAGEVTR